MRSFPDDEVEDEDKFAEERPLDEDEEIPNLIQRDDGFFVVNLHVARYCQSLQTGEAFV